eukprot:TRINITY_DN13775_c0_g1_i1.p1 TRINITY_DN13775_c0_g1~~TRINITY_DN13775_c0_g1_i1.p1  ORF type:complete len:388 (+),score=125.41 TRINITY_DN13775_c0_g1_i1:36-1199(+)
MYSTKGEQFVEKLAETYQNSDKKLSEGYSNLALLSKKKLWHQLTTSLSEFVVYPHFNQKPTELIDLYTNFIIDFDYKLNSLKVATILTEVSRKFPSTNESNNFLEEKLKRLSTDNAKCLLKITIANNHIISGEYQKAKELLDQVYTETEKIDTLEAFVYAKFYQVFSDYHKKLGNATQFYKQSLLFLAYVQIETLSLEQQKSLSYDLILSSLVSDEVYSFGELVTQPILKSLSNTDQQWIVELLNAFYKGDIKTYHKLIETYKDRLNQQPVLTSNVSFLSEKISILGLIELIFNKPSQNRTISFKEISQATFLKLEEVELLVMRALSVGLIRGEIDEVSQLVMIDWVQPRVLSTEQISTLKDKIVDWKEHIKKTQSTIEDQSQELFF